MKLATKIIIMNLCTIHVVKNKFVDELFTLFQLHLLLKPNCLPNNYYAPKMLIQNLGLDYKTIHACVKGFVLSQRDHIKIIDDVQNVMVFIIRMK
jgi:hypothetical protein